MDERTKAKGFANPYSLAKACEGKIGRSTVYRLVEAHGAVENFSASTLEALADVFGVPLAELFERRPTKK